MTADVGRKPKGAPERSPIAGGGAPLGVDGMAPKRYSVQRKMAVVSLLRNEGGSVGTSVAQTVHERRQIFHSLRLGEYLDQLNPAVHSFIAQSRALFQT